MLLKFVDIEERFVDIGRRIVDITEQFVDWNRKCLDNVSEVVGILKFVDPHSKFVINV